MCPSGASPPAAAPQRHVWVLFVMAACWTCCPAEAKAQSSLTFTAAESALERAYHSGGTVGFTDVDNNGWDDLVIFDEGHEIVVEFQGPQGFHAVDMGSLGSSLQWGACVGDLDNSGTKDLFSGGSYDGVHHLSMAPYGPVNFNNLDNGSMFMQGCAMSDLDGDGVLDVFACHDDALSRLWKGNTMGSPTPDAGLMPLTDYATGEFPNTDHSGNYGVVTADVNGDGHTDVYIAKCRQFIIDPTDPRRVNQLWMADGNGGWTEEAASRGLVLHEQSWTADFGDIDNDGDLDALITNHSSPLALLQNDGTGHFTDITTGSGLDVTGFFLQAKLADLDNDGFLDLLTAGGGAAQRLFMGQGDGTFASADWPFTHPDAMLSFAVGDAGRDGTLDVYASYGNVYVSPDDYNPDVLYLNQANGHHWIAFDLQGVTSNLDAVGSRVSLYGPWGVQVREIRAGESYGMTCTHHVHFGIGAAQAVDSAVVRFPGGMEQLWVAPAVDTFHHVVEAPCTLAAFDLLPSGDLSLCPGASVDLTPSISGSAYHWNTGDDSATLTADAPGYYTVRVTDAEGCVGLSEPIRVTRAAEVIPVLEVDGDLIGCSGRTVVLHAISEGAWTWSNGAQTDSLVVTSDGTYHIILEDGCGGLQRSDTAEVVFYDTPGAPQLEDVIVDLPHAVSLNGGGGLLNWFGTEVAATPLSTAPNFTTPVLDSTTTFWVESVEIYGAEGANGGAQVQGNGAYFDNPDYGLLFDAHEDIVIDSVRVFANGAGPRSFALLNPSGIIMEQVTLEVPDGPSYIALSFFVPEGAGYGLRGLDQGMQLWRDGIGTDLEYPYALGSLATITSNNLNNSANNTNYYYYFYDWHVSSIPTVCTSTRTDVTVISLIYGCTYPSASNFEAAATNESGSCIWVGCMDETAINYHPIHTVGDDSCTYTMNPGPGVCPADLNGDGLTGIADLLMLLSDFGELCAE